MAQAQSMAGRTQYTVMTAEGDRLRTQTVTMARTQASAMGIALVEALIGYEWLLSAGNKILSPTFRSGLAQQVKMAMSGNPNTWWVALTARLVLPHTQLCAILVEVGELLVALGFFAGAALWASGRFPTQRWARLLNLGVIGALVGGAVMTVNYYLMSGATLPFLDPGNPFNEGLSIDGLLTFITMGLLFVHVLPIWHRAAPSAYVLMPRSG